MKYSEREEWAEFLKKIKANPADDTVRLVLCDWLEELQDDDATLRAEFIRVQVELSRLESVQCHQPGARMGDSCNDTECPRCGTAGPLYWRERELFAGRCKTWFPCPAAGQWEWLVPGQQSNGCPVGFTIRRGFVAEVRCTLAEWCGGECECLNVPNRLDGMCRTCDNTGRTTGIGPAVIAAHPVVRVVLTDREPAEHVVMSAICIAWAKKS